MSKKLKILIALLITALIIGLMAIAGRILVNRMFRNGHLKGELIAISVSTEGKWKVRLYAIDEGALGESLYAQVMDIKGKTPPRDIPISDIRNESIRWKSADVVDIFGTQINVRMGTVFEGSSVSPNGRWKLNIYFYRTTDGRRSWDGPNYEDHYYVVVVDLRKKEAPKKIIVDGRKISSGDIRWKSANTVDVYGDVLDVSRPGKR